VEWRNHLWNDSGETQGSIMHRSEVGTTLVEISGNGLVSGSSGMSTVWKFADGCIPVELASSAQMQ